MADNNRGVPKVTRQRMAAAESEGGASAAVDNPPAAQTAAPTIRFTRERSPTERADQQKKLAEILRKRGG